MKGLKDFKNRILVVRKTVDDVLTQLHNAREGNYALSKSQSMLNEGNGLEEKILDEINKGNNSINPSFSKSTLVATLDGNDQYSTIGELIISLGIYRNNLSTIDNQEDLENLFQGFKKSINKFSN